MISPKSEIRNSSKIEVLVRVRSLNNKEKAEEAKSIFEVVNDKQIKLACEIANPGQSRILSGTLIHEKTEWNFDYVLGEEKKQADVYSTFGPKLMESCMKGFPLFK